MYKPRAVLTVLLSILTACCTPFLDLSEEAPQFGLTGVDLTPPVLIDASSPDPFGFLVVFNEEIASANLEGLIPLLEGATLEIDGSEVRVRSGQAQQAGTEYAVDLIVRDARGNSQQLLVRCYGHNPRVPAMRINEFTTQGSSTHPDMIEILTLEAGNLAGACVYEGVCDNYEQHLVFPPCEVAAGEFIVVHCKPSGSEEEIDELESTDISGGLDATPTGRDFWLPAGSGLSGNNGVISLYRDPFGVILDAVVYSNRTSLSDETYRGFGSSDTLFRVDTLAEAQSWRGESLPLRPEDAVNPDDSTATRSICRSTAGVDTDRKTDWHIVPTSSASFGLLNCDEVYAP